MDEEQEFDELDDECTEDTDGEENEGIEEERLNKTINKEIVLHCRIILVRNGMASMVLTDQQRRSSFAECKITRLKVCGVPTSSGKFDIIVAKPDNVVVTLRTPRKERVLSESEWKFMSETIEQVLSDNKLCAALSDFGYGGKI